MLITIYVHQYQTWIEARHFTQQQITISCFCAICSITSNTTVFFFIQINKQELKINKVFFNILPRFFQGKYMAMAYDKDFFYYHDFKY